MIANKLRASWSEGRPTTNGWLSISSPFLAEIVAAHPYDSITVDLQHGVIDYAGAVVMLQAMRSSNVVPLVRVPWLEPGIVMKCLDAGAYGIICPMINDRAQAEEFVRMVRFPPDGYRSFGPTRVTISAGGRIAEDSNREVLALAQIETAEAMGNLEAIVSTPGLDGVYIGPGDLAFSLGEGKLTPGLDREEPDMIQAIRDIVDACKAAGVRSGLHCATAEYAARASGWGVDMLTITGDVRLLAAAVDASLKTFHALRKDARGAG